MHCNSAIGVVKIVKRTFFGHIESRVAETGLTVNGVLQYKEVFMAYEKGFLHFWYLDQLI